MNNVQIGFSKQSLKFLHRNQHIINKKQVCDGIIQAVKKLTKEEITTADVIALHGELDGFFRLRLDSVRVIFSIEFGYIHIVEVEQIDFRGNVY